MATEYQTVDEYLKINAPNAKLSKRSRQVIANLLLGFDKQSYRKVL